MKRVLSVIAALSLAVCAHAIDRDGLVGEWTFDDGTAADSSGNGNDGDGAATVVDGISGKAFEFDGSQSIAVNEFSENFVFDQGFTLEVWVNALAGSQTMVRKGGAANFLLELGVGRTNDPGTTPQFGFATDQVGIGASIVTAEEPLPQGQWIFLTMTYDGSFLRGYVDGVLVAENPVTGSAVNDTAQPLLFGNYASEIFIGQLDEIRIWNKPLSQEQIAADFEEFLPSLETALEGEWLFEGSPEDSSGNGNDGEISGGVTLTEGINGQAYEFDGTGAITTAQFTDNSVFDTAFTLTVWVKPLEGSQTMIRKGGAANFLLELGVGRTNDPGTTPQFGFATDEVNIGASIVTGTTALPLGQWSFLTMTYDGSNLRGYINGVLVASNPVTGSALNDAAQPLLFGNYSSEVFIGQLDEIRIWSRTLRQIEIQDLFSQSADNPDVFQLQLGSRVLDDVSYTPGTPVPVAIQLVGQPGSVTVTETPPAGWAVSNISHGGVLADGVITWDVADFTGDLALQYVITPPDDAEGEAVFAGTTGADPTGGFDTMVPSDPVGIFENHVDIGDVAQEGSVVFEDGTYTMTAAGREIWNHMDEFHFAYIRTAGDFTISGFAENFPLESQQDWLKTGLVARDTLAPESSYALIFVRTDLQMSKQFRPKTGVYPDRDGTLVGLDAQDGRMVLERVGDTFNLYYLTPGTDDRVLFDSMDIEMEDPVYVGIATSASLGSASDGIGLVEGTFTDVVFEGQVPVAEWALY